MKANFPQPNQMTQRIGNRLRHSPSLLAGFEEFIRGANSFVPTLTARNVTQHLDFGSVE